LHEAVQLSNDGLISYPRTTLMTQSVLFLWEKEFDVLRTSSPESKVIKSKLCKEQQ
jgi:hypothetical protein